MIKEKDKKILMEEKPHKGRAGKLILMTSFLSGITGAFVAYMTPKIGEIVREKILHAVDLLKKSETQSEFTSQLMSRSVEVINLFNQKTFHLLEHGVNLINDTKELFFTAYIAGKEAYESEDTGLIEENKKIDSDTPQLSAQDISDEHKTPDEDKKETSPLTYKEEKEIPSVSDASVKDTNDIP
jgi:hypothetical protein